MAERGRYVPKEAILVLKSVGYGLVGIALLGVTAGLSGAFVVPYI